MRAIQIEAFGGPEVLELADVPVPEPGEGEVLIRVSRAGMNYADTHQRTNDYLASYDLPLVPGGEVAGVRDDTGERVVAMCGLGGYAEYATAPAALTFPIPDSVDDGTALALLIQVLTAWHLYRTSAKVAPGESVVVHAAAGGVGSIAVQLGKPMGAGRVIATASTEDKRALALELGADAAIDADPEGMAERLVEANLGERVDVVFEMAGGEVFTESSKALAPFGRLVAYPGGGDPADARGPRHHRPGADRLGQDRRFRAAATGDHRYRARRGPGARPYADPRAVHPGHAGDPHLRRAQGRRRRRCLRRR